MSCGQRKIARHDWKTVVAVDLASIGTFLGHLKRKLKKIKREESVENS